MAWMWARATPLTFLWNMSGFLTRKPPWPLVSCSRSARSRYSFPSLVWFNSNLPNYGYWNIPLWLGGYNLHLRGLHQRPRSSHDIHHRQSLSRSERERSLSSHWRRHGTMADCQEGGWIFNHMITKNLLNPGFSLSLDDDGISSVSNWWKSRFDVAEM